ncbi:hypothetical protein FKR81_35250 [Lentzea tibetensis]|uniref:Carrier domain-containing protein n=1 Tax=Lentzea tibetensis TaxID=2591470 RepID=A0A563EIQ4_9PSEU|nr:hypothetical protein FKR81_35250 [Lentzea tibetensis]
MTAVELRTMLTEATGRELPADLTYRFATPRELAAHLETGAESSAPSPHSVESLYVDACLDGRGREFMNVLTQLARFRPAFDNPLDLDHAPRPVRLARGDGGPHLILLPAIVGFAGAQQFTRFASGFASHDVSVLPEPGFRPGELLPADLDVAVESLAMAAVRLANGQPFVVGGYSSGAFVAHEVVHRLEKRGHAADGLVLLDVYLPQAAAAIPGYEQGVLDGLVARRDLIMGAGDEWPTAMARYWDYFWDWKPAQTSTPTLLVRATEPISAEAAAHDWRSDWEFDCDVVDVPGNHFTFMEDHAAQTSRVVREWLMRKDRT